MAEELRELHQQAIFTHFRSKQILGNFNPIYSPPACPPLVGFARDTPVKFAALSFSKNLTGQALLGKFAPPLHDPPALRLVEDVL